MSQTCDLINKTFYILTLQYHIGGYQYYGARTSVLQNLNTRLIRGDPVINTLYSTCKALINIVTVIAVPLLTRNLREKLEIFFKASYSNLGERVRCHFKLKRIKFFIKQPF